MAGFVGTPPIVTDGLIFAVDAANYESYSGSGTTWKDLSDNNNDGTLVNGPTFDSANGGSIVFDGTDDYVNFVNNSILKPTTSMTLMVWAKGQSVGPSVGLFGTMGFNRGYLIGCNTSNFYFFIAQSSSVLVSVTSPHTDTTTSPFMITGVFSASNFLKIYKNENELATNTTSIPSTQYTGNGRPLQIGNRGDNIGDGYWDGEVYYAMIYNRALSSAEVLQNYNALKGRFNL
jgi:hypothetical protein